MTKNDNVSVINYLTKSKHRVYNKNTQFIKFKKFKLLIKKKMNELSSKNEENR